MGRPIGKAALVAGASHGIGEGTAITFAKHGAKLTLLDISEEVGLLAQKLNEQGCPCITLNVDVRNPELMAAAVAKGKEAMDDTDTLVNDAGVCRLGGSLEMSDTDGDFHIDINIKGVWNVMKAVFPGMVAKKDGRIVIMSPVAGDMVVDPGETVYALLKAALVGFTKPLAMEFAQSSIRVNVIYPGYMRTPMAESIAWQPNVENPEFVLTEITEVILMRKLAAPAEIGELATLLDSNESSHLTGIQSVIDGGSTLSESVSVGV